MTVVGHGEGASPSTANPPGQGALRRRVTTHGASLERMRARLGSPESDLRLRSLAHQPTDDPSIAMLDAWAVVADIVAFYSERIATEGFLRTATERRSVRELARMLGYELRPGVAAQVELAFSAETAAGAPPTVQVPRGTPVQSIPLQDQLPQTFETTDDLEVRGAWNAVPLIDFEPQALPDGTPSIWLELVSTTVIPGDSVLVVQTDRWDLRVVSAVEAAPETLPGWVRLDLDAPIAYRASPRRGAVPGVYVFGERTHLFGWNAPDPSLMPHGDGPPAGAELDPAWPPNDKRYRWLGFDAVDEAHPDQVEVDGEHERLRPETWMVVDQAQDTAELAWQHVDLSMITAARPAAGDPTGYVWERENRQHVVYRGTDDHIHELRQALDGPWEHLDLTVAAGAPEDPPAVGDPFGYVFPADNRQYVVYRDARGHIHFLANPAPWGGWGHVDLTDVVGAPDAAGDPHAYVYAAENWQYVVYRGADDHIHEIGQLHGREWGHVDLTAAADAQAAAGDPSGYEFAAEGQRYVVYRDVDYHITQLSAGSESTWNFTDLTDLTEAPAAAGDPYPCMWFLQHIVYRTAEGHVQDLWQHESGRWDTSDLTSRLEAPDSEGDPAEYLFLTDRYQLHAVYRAADNHIHDLRYPVDDAWAHFDLSALMNAPAAAGEPHGYGFVAENRQHVVYRGADGHIHQLAYPARREARLTEMYRVVTARPDGAAKFALSGRLTRVSVDLPWRLAEFDRRRALVHCSPIELPAREKPLQASIRGNTLVVALTDPPLSAGRAVIVAGTVADGGAHAAEAAVVVDCKSGPGPATMTVELDRSLAHEYRPQGLVLHANVVAASHGETVEQVLGSGDGRIAFPQFRPRRMPLTYVRSTTPGGARAELSLRVDGVEWSEVVNLDDAGPTDRVYVIRHEEGEPVRVVLGDGSHGARPSTGVENITARYRVGIGEPGAMKAGQVALLSRRPLGIREVHNPGPAHDWAAPEMLQQARINAPLRVRTLDRAVSVLDHQDFAAGYAGVGSARADLVWNGRSSVLLVSVLGAAGQALSLDLVRDLKTAMQGARDPGTTLEVVAGELLLFGIRFGLSHDPAYERSAVDEQVRIVLSTSFGAAARQLGAPITAAEVLVAVKATRGVLACTMPKLLLGHPPHPPHKPDDLAHPEEHRLLAALPGRWDDGLRPAQMLALDPDGIELAVMGS